MFFLIPRVTLVLLVLFAALLIWRAWRLRHRPALGRSGHARPPPRWTRRRRQGRHPRSRSALGEPLPLVPAALLRGADRTWVVFTTPDCAVCRQVAARLREAEPQSRIVEVDTRQEPRLVEAFGIPRLPAVLLANRYGQAEARLVGLAAIDDFTSAQAG